MVHIPLNVASHMQGTRRWRKSPQIDSRVQSSPENYLIGFMERSDFRNSTDAAYMELNCSGEYDNGSSVVALISHTDPDYLSYRQSYITILITLAFFGILLNGLLIFYMLRRNMRQNHALRSLILQLSIANLMVAVFCLLADGIWNITVQWYGGDLLCRLIKYLQMLSLYAATLILTGMSIEACVTVTFPLTKSYRPVTLLRARVTSIFSWLLAAFSSIPQAIIFHTEKAPICEEFYQCVTHGFYVSSVQELVYTMATLCLMCIVPLLVITICYIIIFVKMSKEAKIASGNSSSVALLRPRLSQTTVLRDDSQGRKVYARTRQLFLWMTFITALTFIICWVPYYFAMFAYLFQWTISPETLSAIYCFGMSSSVISPLIFGGFFMCKKESERDNSTQLRSTQRGTFSTTMTEMSDTSDGKLSRYYAN